MVWRPCGPWWSCRCGMRLGLLHQKTIPEGPPRPNQGRHCRTRLALLVETLARGELGAGRLRGGWYMDLGDQKHRGRTIARPSAWPENRQIGGASVLRWTVPWSVAEDVRGAFDAAFRWLLPPHLPHVSDRAQLGGAFQTPLGQLTLSPGEATERRVNSLDRPTLCSHETVSRR